MSPISTICLTLSLKLQRAPMWPAALNACVSSQYIHDKNVTKELVYKSEFEGDLVLFNNKNKKVKQIDIVE
jgi:hypothetical protein